MALCGTAPSTSIQSLRTSSPSESLDDNSNKLTLYLHRLAGHHEIEVDFVIQDHSYARPWNWKPENIYVKPIKKLFFPKPNLISSEKSIQNLQNDIEDENEDNQKHSIAPPLDLTKTRYQMEEFQRLANFARPDDIEDWEERIDKILWTPIQNRIFTKVMKILNSERLSRLAKSHDPMEPIFRRNSIDNTARRFREILASTGWDWRVVQWLHSLLFDHLPQEYLAIYFEILQTMRSKIPQLIDKMISIQTNITSKGTPITWETLGSFLKRSWDPIAPTLNANRLKKLPGNPILIIAPSVIGNTISPRQHKWVTQLGALGMVVNVNTNLGLASNRMTMMVCIDQLVQALRVKIQDVRSDYPGRPVVLVGFDTGAALACQIAQMENVTAVVCLGFPFLTVEGKRGTPDDTLMDIRCPVMFVIGQNSGLARIDDLEDLRGKMMVETSLVVVGSADDNLRISTHKKLSEGITQNMVDRCILDEIGDFVGSILLQPHPLPLRPTVVASFENKNIISHKKEIRKRKNSTSSSVESEPNSPTMKKSRSTTPVPTTVALQVPTTSNKTGNSTPQPMVITTNNNGNNTTTTTTTTTSAIKRKPRVMSNQKGHFVERLISSRTPGQTNIHSENGGITLNIGSLASLAPIGPIRLSASPSDNTVNLKSSTSTTKISKIIPTNMPLQTISRMKTIVPSNNKGIAKIIPGGAYRNVNNASEKIAENNKLINITPGNTSGIQKGVIGLGNGNSTVQSGKGSTLRATTPSTSNILLTPNNAVTSSSTPTISKAIDESNPSSQRTVFNSLDITSKIVQITPNNYKDKREIVMLPESLRKTRPTTPSPIIFPFNQGNMISSKTTTKLIQNMPKITINANNLHRMQKGTLNEIDEDLGNILDIPIIFAKDDDNLCNLDRIQQQSSIEPNLSNRLNSTTKVVLISNKQDKSNNKQPIICPNNISNPNNNHIIVQTRMKNQINLPLRSNQPTIKYTKIILAKRNPNQRQPFIRDDRNNEQVVVTKTNNTRIHALSKTLLSRLTDDNNSRDNEDTVIERKCLPIPEIDLTSPKKTNNVQAE